MDLKFLDSEVKRINDLFKYYNSVKIIINDTSGNTIDDSVATSDNVNSTTSDSIDSGYTGDIDLDNLVEKRNYMVVDVETSFNRNLIQIAYNIYDNKHRLIKEFDTLIDDGIGEVDYYKKYTIEDIMLEGMSSREAFQIVKNDINGCSHVIGHNIAFDMGVIDRYFKKLKIPYDRPESICTMRLATNYCKLKGKGKSYKVPKLSELYVKCFNREPDNTKTHTADYDIHITYLCFRHLLQNNIIKM